MKLFSRLFFLFISVSTFAQTESFVGSNFNRWSVEFKVGQNRPVKPFQEGYYSSDPSRLFNFQSLTHFNVATRYMFTDVFGFKTDLTFDKFTNQSGTSSLDFNSKQYGLGFEAVVNLAKLCKFDSFTRTVSLLCHTGLKFSKFDSSTQFNGHVSKEKNIGVMFGLTPQIKLYRSLALTLDFTIVNNFRQHLNWDGSPAGDSYNLNGFLYTSSIGFSYSLGSNNLEHADWVSSALSHSTKLDLLKRIALLEGKVKENHKNKFAIDSLKTVQKLSVLKKSNNFSIDSILVGSNNEMLSQKDLISKFNNSDLDVFFNTTNDKILSDYLGNIQKVVSILKMYPNLKLKITGHADATDNRNKNIDLCIRRARKVANIIIRDNINPDRISFTGQGIDQNKSVSDFGNILSRRVSFHFFVD